MCRWSHSTFLCIVTAVLTTGLAAWTSPADAQLAPWQQPPGWQPQNGEPARVPIPATGEDDNVESSPKLAAGPDAVVASEPGIPSDADDVEMQTPLGLPYGFWRQMIHGRVWFTADALGWWTKGSPTPPLLISAPVGTTTPAQDQPGTSALWGGKDFNQGIRPGERFSLGTWLDDFALEFDYLNVSESFNRFSIADNGTSVLARPFFDLQQGIETSLPLVGFAQASFSSRSTSEFQAAEFLLRQPLYRGPRLRADLLLGYRYQELRDGLIMTTSLPNATADSGLPAGSSIQSFDMFNTRNDFSGGEVGIDVQWHPSRWTFATNGKVAVGGTRTRVTIDGATDLEITGDTGSGVQPGGLLSLPSNIGVHDSHQLSLVSEAGLTIGYDLTQRLRVNLGYTFMYWTNVARPGAQIDRTIDTVQVPTIPPVANDATRPAFEMHRTDFWAQGANLGFDWRF